MRLNLNFKLMPGINEAMNANNGANYDGENVCIYSEVPGYKINVVITLDKHIFSIVNKLDSDSINKTRRNLKEAVKKAIKNGESQGVFTLFIEGGAFDIAG